MVASALAGLELLVKEYRELDGDGLLQRVKPGESKFCQRRNKKADGKWRPRLGRCELSNQKD